MTGDEAKARWICCPMCDKKRCQISLTVNGRCLPDPQITISSTGDGILGPEIWFDVNGEWLEPEADGISMLDKIRAEIEAEPYISKMEVLDIIDKYKAEKRG